MKPYLIIGVLLLVAATGYVKGRVDNEAKHTASTAQDALDTARDAATTAGREADRLFEESARTALSYQLEDAANAQVPSAVCLPASRVLRLNQR